MQRCQNRTVFQAQEPGTQQSTGMAISPHCMPKGRGTRHFQQLFPWEPELSRRCFAAELSCLLRTQRVMANPSYTAWGDEVWTSDVADGILVPFCFWIKPWPVDLYSHCPAAVCQAQRAASSPFHTYGDGETRNDRCRGDSSSPAQALEINCWSLKILGKAVKLERVAHKATRQIPRTLGGSSIFC